MAAALQWIASQGLAAWAGDADSAWAVCEEAAGCVRSGALRRGGVAGGGPGTADGLLSWVLEAGQDKAVPLARMAAFRLLADGIIADCPAPVLASPAFEKLCQLLRSGTSPAAPAPCRQLACQATAALVARGYSSSGSGSIGGGGEEAAAELEQKVQDALPRLMAALLGCAGADEPDGGVKTAALTALTAAQLAAGTLVKPFAAKMEAAVYATLASSEEPARRSAACRCLARIPSTLSDPAAWTAMLLALLADAARTLQHVWSDCPALHADAIATPPSPHKPALGVLPREPEATGGGVKAYAVLARRRLDAALSAAVALLEAGYHHGGGSGSGGNSPVVLPTPQLLALCDALLAATPKGASPLGTTPSALPPTALHALQPLLRQHGLALLAAFLPAAHTACVRHLPRLNRGVLRALSWPLSQGFRPQAYRLLGLLVRLAPSGAALKGLVEPALPLLAHHAALLVKPAAPASLAAALASSCSSSAAPFSGGSGDKRKKKVAAARNNRGAAAAGAGTGEEVGHGEGEVVQLGVAVFGVLETVLLGSGALLSLDGRVLIDRVVGSGLAELNRGVPRDGARQPALSWVRRSGPLRAAFLHLAVRALLVPRPDGTGSALTPLAARVFGALVLDPNEDVALAALLGRAAAETIIHPRAAPVFIPPVLLRLDDEGEEGEVGVRHGGRKRQQQQQQQQAQEQDEQEDEAAVLDVVVDPPAAAPGAVAADVWSSSSAGKGAGSGKRKAPQPPPSQRPAKAKATPVAQSGGGSGRSSNERAAAAAAKEEEEEDDEPLPDVIDESEEEEEEE